MNISSVSYFGLWFLITGSVSLKKERKKLILYITLVVLKSDIGINNPTKDFYFKFFGHFRSGSNSHY